MPAKPKVALYWCASCGGCEEAVVDLAEGILDVVAAVDIVLWPVAMDFKRGDTLCLAGNRPCAGCFGPTSRVHDQGAKFLSSVAGIVAAKTDEEIEKVLAGIPDPVGSFYRYGLARSSLRMAIRGER
jgi:coenzyme F420-reducing hydrogenase gamma subunit